MKKVYCTFCGKEMIIDSITESLYDKDTGIREYYNNYKCPDSKWYFNFHDKNVHIKK